MSFTNNVPQAKAALSACSSSHLPQMFHMGIEPSISDFSQQRAYLQPQISIPKNNENLAQNQLENTAIRKKSHERLRHCAFSPEEDSNLRNLISKHGENNWGTISLSMVRRSARQCKDRWMVLKKREESKRPWTSEEDNLLVQKCIDLGPKWGKIELFFTGRDIPSIKSRWKLLTRNAEMDSLMMSEQNRIKTENVQQSQRYDQVGHNHKTDKSPNPVIFQQPQNNYVNSNSNNFSASSSYNSDDTNKDQSGIDFDFWSFLNLNNDDNSDDLFAFMPRDESILNSFW